MFASWVEYFIGLKIRDTADFDIEEMKLPLGLNRIPVDSPWFLIAARAIPGYGPKVVGLVGGIYNVSLWRFTWTAALPTAFGAFLFAYADSD